MGLISKTFIIFILTICLVQKYEAEWKCPGCCAVGINLNGTSLCLCNQDCNCNCTLLGGCDCPTDENGDLLCKCSNIARKV